MLKIKIYYIYRMETLLSVITITIFIVLALLHFFWLCGGQWGMQAAVPTDFNGRKIFKPSWVGTLLVAIGLLFFAWINMCIIGALKVPFNPSYARYGMYMISGIFFLRFIGDLKYVGLFKKYRQSAFASRDTYIYTPLSLFLSIANGFLAFS